MWRSEVASLILDDELSAEALLGGVMGLILGAIAVILTVGWINLVKRSRKEWPSVIWEALESGLVVAHYGAIIGAVVGLVIGELPNRIGQTL